MYSKHYMTAHLSNLPQNDPLDFGLERMREGNEPELLAQPINTLMKGIYLRVLVNGLNDEAKNMALNALFKTLHSAEQIETELQALSQRAPYHFPAQNVAMTAAWVQRTWNDRAQGRQ